MPCTPFRRCTARRLNVELSRNLTGLGPALQPGLVMLDQGHYQGRSMLVYDSTIKDIILGITPRACQAPPWICPVQSMTSGRIPCTSPNQSQLFARNHLLIPPLKYSIAFASLSLATIMIFTFWKVLSTTCSTTYLYRPLEGL